MTEPAAGEAGAPASTGAAGVAGDEKLAADVLRAEYGVLMSGISASWSASLTRTSLLLGVFSAAAVAIGLAAQAAGGFGRSTLLFALTVLPLVLFLGVATFVRQLYIQRELVVLILGMNRIRRYMADLAPSVKPYLVLATSDDELSLYRNFGTGMVRRPPRYRLAHALVQVQGIVAVVTSQVAAAIAGIAVTLLGGPPWLAWSAAALAFATSATLLLSYWSRSFAELQRGIRPRFPTPPEAVDAPY